MNTTSETKRTAAEPNDRYSTSVKRLPTPRKASPMNIKNPVFFATKFLLLLLLFVSAQLFSMQSASAQAQPYTKLPPEVAEEMKWMAWNAAWAAANYRFNNNLAGIMNEGAFNTHSVNMSDKAKGLEGVSQSTLDDIKWFAWNAAWHTANFRKGLSTDADNSNKNANEHLQRVRNSGQLGSTLIDSIRDMVWAAAWHAANNKVNYKDDALRNQLAFDSESAKIPGVVKFVRIDMGPVELGEDELKIDRPGMEKNCGPKDLITEPMAKFTSGKVDGWSHEVGFNFSATAGVNVEAGVIFAKATASMNFTVGVTYNKTWHSQTTTEETVEIKRTITTPPHSVTFWESGKYKAPLTASYDIIYAIDGKEYKVHGNMQGTGANPTEIFNVYTEPYNPAIHGPCLGGVAASSTNDEVNVAVPTDATTALVEANRIFLPLIANAGAVTDEGNVMTKTEATTEPATDERNDTVVTAATLELGSAEANGTLTAETMTDVASAELNLTAATETLVGDTESNRIYLPLIANDNL